MSTRTLLAAAALAALLPLGAQADSGTRVYATSTVAGAGPDGSTDYSWNYYAPDGYTMVKHSAASTGSVTGSATAAAAQAHDTGMDAFGTYAASSTASADLATATLTGSASNSGFVKSTGSEIGQPFAENYDVLTFTAAGASASTVTTFGVSYTLHESLTLLPGTTSSANESYISNVLSFDHQATSYFYVNDAGDVAVLNGTGASNWPDGTWTATGSAADETFTFNGTISFTGASWTSPFDQSLQMECYDGAQCSASASVSFGLPTSVTLSSESGAFLTAASPSAVPEPQNALLLLAGLGALAMAARRRANAARA